VQGKRSSDGGKQRKAEARIAREVQFSFSHMQQVGSFSSLFHPMWHCKSSGHIFLVLCPLSFFEKRRESGKSSLGRKLLICIFTHGSSLSGFFILCGASNPKAMVVVFVLLFFPFFFSFLQIGVSRPSNNPLGEKLLIFIFTLGGSVSGFIICGTFTPIAMGCFCPLIIIIFKGFKFSTRFQFIYFTLL